jgi:hypothetical protein
MVHLIATDAAYERLKAADSLPAKFWLNTKDVPEDERLALQKDGRLVGWFVPPFDTSDPKATGQAIDTVEQHHAGSRVVVVAE